jgi:acetylornithine deacetylase/succinyl-diaminopimelate desuccinylase-like protein
MYKKYKNILIISALTLAATCAFGAEPAAPPVNPRARELLAMLIGINSTHSHGSTEAARALKAALERGGFPAEDIELILPAPDKGNLLVRLRGSAHGRPLLFLSHLDVVEARPEDWSVPPFQLTEKDGYFYGRGTQDVKGDAAAAAANLIRLHAEHYTPDRDLYFAFTSDEEAGGTLDGVEWLMAHRPELHQVDYVVNFDAGGGDAEHGRPLLFRVQTSEKVYATFTLEATSPGGHSSLPTPDNAIYRLAHGLIRIEAAPFPIHLTDTARGYFAALATTDSAHAADMQAVAKSGDVAAAQRLAQEPQFNALVRTTCVATEVTAGHAENALPQRARATIQCRLIPGESSDAVREALTRVVADPALTLRASGKVVASPESPLNATLFSTVRTVAGELWPGAAVAPSMDAGADDSVYTRNAGIASYGVSGLFADLDGQRAHGRDERMRISEFDADVEFQYRFFKLIGRTP